MPYSKYSNSLPAYARRIINKCKNETQNEIKKTVHGG